MGKEGDVKNIQIKLSWNEYTRLSEAMKKSGFSKMASFARKYVFDAVDRILNEDPEVSEILEKSNVISIVRRCIELEVGDRLVFKIDKIGNTIIIDFSKKR